MHPKTIDNLFIVNYQNEFSGVKDYDTAFEYTTHYLMPKAKNIHILYNGLEFDYFNDEENKEVHYYPESYSKLVSHYEKHGIHGLTSVPRIVIENSVIPLTKRVQIYPKTFYYILPWIHLGLLEKDIINAIEEMYEEDLESMEIDGKFIFLPTWFLDLSADIEIEEENNNVLVGGMELKCLKELEFLFKASGIDFTINKSGVFGK